MQVQVINLNVCVAVRQTPAQVNCILLIWRRCRSPRRSVRGQPKRIRSMSYLVFDTCRNPHIFIITFRLILARGTNVAVMIVCFN